ncbi:MAG: hypothetical protein AAGI48_13075 [Verrucomicrobiota bacterium]
MKALRISAWILCGLLGLLLVVALILAAAKAQDYGGESVQADPGIGRMLEAAPSVDSPPDFEYSDFIDHKWTNASDELKAEFAGSNAFILIQAFLLLFGLLGYTLMVAALARRSPARFSPLIALGVISLTFFSFLVFGFDFAYPAEYLPGRLIADYSGPWFIGMDADPFQYGLAFTMWTDFLFQAAYAMTASMLVLGLLAGNYRAPAVAITSLAVGVIGYPLITSWIWADGWLSNLGSYDFAGGANLHVLSGSAGFALILLSRIFPAEAPGKLSTATSHQVAAPRVPAMPWNPRRMTVFLIGAVIFLFGPLAVQIGSVLSNDHTVVPVVATTAFAAIVSAACTSLVLSFFLRGRPRLVTVTIGGLAGWSAICAPGDLLDLSTASVIGALAGAFSCLLLWVMDRTDFDDPMGLVPIGLVGGTIGLIAAGAISEETSLIVQFMVVIATISVGFTLGTCTGLLAWLTGFLWERQEQSTPAAPPPLQTSP